MPLGAPAAEGPAAIEAYRQAVIGSGLSDLTLSPTEVIGAGDEATEVGVARANIGAGKYIVVRRRSAEGRRMHRDIFNSDA